MIEFSAYKRSRRNTRQRVDPATIVALAHTFVLGVYLGQGRLAPTDLGLLRRKIEDWIIALETRSSASDLVATLRDLYGSALLASASRPSSKVMDDISRILNLEGKV